MTFQVITVTNSIPKEQYYCWAEFFKSLDKFGVKPTILGMGEPWGGLMTKPRTLRKYLRDGKSKAGCLIVVDSWDLVFAKDPAQIAREWRDIGAPWMAGGEKNLFPSGDESAYPSGAFRFLNSGFIISTPEDMLAVLEDMNLDTIPDDHVDVNGNNVHPNDQEEYQKAFLRQPIPMVIDTEAKFVANLCGVKRENVEYWSWENPSTGIKAKTIRMTETCNEPYALHLNGPAKTDGLQEPILHHLGLR